MSTTAVKKMKTALRTLVVCALLACSGAKHDAPRGAAAAGSGADAAMADASASAGSAGSHDTTDAATSSAGTSSTALDSGMDLDAGNEPAGESVCGTADEGAVITLACKSGQIIDRIVFASYGAPTGACGAFATGTCNATTSVSVVEQLCLGRASCSVPATNGAFADPCNRVAKRLAVEAVCVVGAPVEPMQPFKGVANSPCAARTALGVSWYYNWGADESEPCASPQVGGEFVPMIWGAQTAAKIQSAITGFVGKGYAHVLGFNEPDHSDQANMSVSAAITLWPAFDNAAIKLVSPAAASDGRPWAADFMTQVGTNGLRVDVLATHWYGWNAGSCDAKAAGLENHIAWAEGVAGNRPIWLTEWGCLNQSAPDENTVVAFYQGALAVFARHPRVQRYAWYPWATNCGLVNSDATLTALGKVYAAAPAYR